MDNFAIGEKDLLLGFDYAVSHAGDQRNVFLRLAYTCICISFA